jgi:hypothetical protein
MLDSDVTQEQCVQGRKYISDGDEIEMYVQKKNYVFW